jgi:multiple sugar transport system substrate-binding protein
MGQVRFLGPDTDAFVSSVERHRDEFETTTGLSLDVRSIPSDLYFCNRIETLLDGEDPADVYMSGPVLVWEHMKSGFVQPLDEFINRSSDEWAFDDFVSRLVSSNRWSGVFGEPLGNGPLLEIPVNCESYNLAYVPAVLETAGLAVPTTWSDYFAAARAVVGAASRDTRGFGQRGAQAWHTMYTGFATQLWSYGGGDFQDGTCIIASPISIEATELFINALRDAGPPDWTKQRWYELALDFASGKYGLLVDSDHYVAYFEDPNYSNLVGQIAYAMPPAGPAGRRPNLWTWSIVMNTRSRQPDSAWRFIEWATSSRFLLRSIFEGNMNPTRTSVWDNEQFRQHASRWGSFYDVSRQLIEREASVLVTPAPNYLQIADRWVVGLREAYSGKADVAEALQAAASDIDRLVGKRTL